MATLVSRPTPWRERPRPGQRLPLEREIDAETERAARVFLKRFEGKYPAIQGTLYGSRAHGDHKPDRDADIAVILRGERGDRYKVSGEFAGIEFHVLMETGVMVQGLPLSEGELARPYPALNRPRRSLPP